MPPGAGQITSSNNNLILCAPSFDEEKLLIYREIFYGGFSTVIAARDLTSGAAIAIKKVEFNFLSNCFDGITQLEQAYANKIRQQTAKLRCLSHPALFKTLELVVEANRFMLVTEMCLFGDLFNWILQQQSLRIRDVCIIIQGLFQALKFLHSKEYIHGHLKPTSVLFQTVSPQSLIILPDFSVKKEVAILLNDPTIQCLSCFAPEARKATINEFEQSSLKAYSNILPNESNDLNKLMTKEMDTWSIAAIALIALTGEDHFRCDTLEELDRDISNAIDKAFSHPVFSFCRDTFANELRKFIEVDPTKRTSVEIGSEINWINVANAKENDKNILFLTEYNLQNTYKYFRLFGENTFQRIIKSV